ncbi:MAG: hypothetical protein WC719_00150 [Patescibacteria group bacterium]|jgi:hypothetical protein
MLKIKKSWLILGVCFFVSALFLAPSVSEAAVCDQNTNITFVARDPGGSYIMNARVDVYKQERDANGVTRPTTKFTGGNTDSVLGRVNLSWRNSNVSSDNYVIRVQTISKDNASFWFYGINLDCGETASVERTLSGALFTLYDSDNNLLTNTAFNVYSQTTDTDGAPLKNELLAGLNSGSTGRVKTYLPQGSVRSLDGTLKDLYAMEITYNGVKSYFYNIQIYDGQLTNVNYYLSVIKVRLKDASDNNATGAKVEVYNQSTDASDNYVKGSKIGEFTIGDNGYGSMEIAPGLYMLAVKNADGTYKYFWDNRVADGATSQFFLTLDKAYSSSSSDSTSASGVCNSSSNLNLTLRNAAGDIAPGLKFEVYTQAADANGLPAAGTKVSSGTIDSGGRATVSFKPDTTKTYALKIWDKKADLGEFWFFDALKFTCATDKTIAKTIPVLKIILRDGKGNLKRNHDFSLSAQQYDADNNPIIPNNGLIANMKTDAGGQAYIYVAPYNPYRRNQTGRYVVSSKNASGTTIVLYNIIVSADKDTTFEARIKENAPSTSSTSSSSAAANSAANSTSSSNSAAAAASSLAQSLKGRILLQVQDKGQAWYVNPIDSKKYYLGRPTDAFNLMRRFGLGISNENFTALAKNPSAWKNLAGRILLKTEDKGMAYYFDPLKLKLYYLGRPADAFNVIRSRGLGISNANLDKIATGK